jgi:hypothetical protein
MIGLYRCSRNFIGAKLQMKAIVVVLSILTGTLAPLNTSDAAQEQCETSKAGIKRCETNISNAAKNIPNMKTIVWTDRAHEIVEWEINFPMKMDGVWPAGLIGAAMSILAPNSIKEARGELFKRLIVNAGKGSFDFIPLENYEWISSVKDGIVMIRASRRRH